MQRTLNCTIRIEAWHVTGATEIWTYTLTPDQCASEQRAIVVEAALTLDALHCGELYNDAGYFADGKVTIHEGDDVADAVNRWDLYRMVGGI